MSAVFLAPRNVGGAHASVPEEIGAQTVTKTTSQAVACVRDMRSIPTSAYRLSDDGRKWRTLCEDRKRLADWLATYANGNGTRIFPSIATIERTFDTWSRAKIFRVLDALHRLRILSRQGYNGEHGTRIRSLHPDVLRGPGISCSRANVSDSTDQESQIREAGVSDSEARSLTYGETQPALSSIPTKFKTTPLPPAKAGEQEIFIEWCWETIGVQMGRRHRLPNLHVYVGGRASDVVAFLVRKGFLARIVDPSELSSDNFSVKRADGNAIRSAAV